ncbi:Stk1 family PASTA domain-containing Ser/Thr kinase [Pseudarthrobacter cellobiosi]|uniref:Stk1 family PASTA domain-containing Ser/Thr kinase n=1 Tax=Pseudarthrobacter cellobiosi TaxID=2953654 RepID=UPI00208E7523|nr:MULTISPECIES: Stk1 family PASTA domain-containing Ser/Thr kinase [unclassified Pseudarthrobacter]MCO4256630.1 Stk1 family PASTA domain-containing Ser/Thr kinase [Pseudarthrobacter sp. HLT1-5]MCO4276253.1 Stk1 family PASTA domain-containing Ser/Thr kinase [Pseudarthrobacter sp. HLT3-5]
MQEQVSDRLVGTLVDNRYAVRSKLARGGMSTVYLATDLRLERDVALKVLHPHLATDETFLDRLGREAKAAAKLSHAHVVGVLDQGNDGQTAYLVMEHIKGHTLRDVIRSKGALPPRLALALIDPVVQGLGAAHAAGLIHRDVKPENVLIADDGRIKIGDFGLARAVTTSTSTGTLIGTVGYLSPELVLGKQADTRSDIYSVGIMLYEMLTGQQPYDGEVPIQVAYKHVNESVGPPSALVPGLAAEVDELVQWCTANDPENRPVDGNALLQELRHIRTNLTDAELDLRPPAAAPAGQQNPTEIIARTNNPTAVMSSFSRPQPPHPPHAPHALYPPDADYRPGEQFRPEAHYRPYAQDAVPAAIPLSKRARRKLDREDEKARSRAAATPVRSLREGNPRRRGALWVVVLVIIALLATGAGWFFGMGPGSPGTIPAVANKPVAQAQQLLSEAGFQSRTNDVFDDDVPSGLVVGSDPTAGTETRKFQLVSLFVSKGPQLFELPKLTGGTLDDAKNALNQAEMALGTVTEQFDDAVAAGVVLSQDPAAATPARHGTPVNLLVSKGPQPIPAPSVVGLAEDAAVDAIEAAGLKADIAKDKVNDPKVPKGSVAAQSPATGTLTKGGTVTLTISDGPKLVEVPSFIGKQAKEAEEALRALGFEVRVNNILGGFFGTVRDQDPVKKKVPEGSVVTLTVV